MTAVAKGDPGFERAGAVCVLVSLLCGLSPPPAQAQPDPPAPSRLALEPEPGPFQGPFTSAHLFEMPTAQTVGPYRISLSYDGSLLAEPGILSSAGLLAFGFGEYAQLEYRHTSAISVTGSSAPLPTAGVHFIAPLPRGDWPQLGVAVRAGLPRDQAFEAVDLTERATDGYLVTGYRPPFGQRPLQVHASVRLTRAVIEVRGLGDHDVDRTMVLPAFGFEWLTSDATRLVGEMQLSPRFNYDIDQALDEPTIDRALQGRLGLRWRVVPSLSFDASLGYRYLGADHDEGLFLWDIRLGGEVHFAWDALACRALSVLCRRN